MSRRKQSLYVSLNEEALDLQMRLAHLSVFVGSHTFSTLTADERKQLLDNIHSMELNLAALNLRIGVLEG